MNDWRIIRETPTKRVLMRMDKNTHEIVFCEEWLEDPHIEAARQQRERPALVSPDLKPLAIIPDSVQAEALKDGWYHDRDKWRKWAADISNRKLQLT